MEDIEILSIETTNPHEEYHKELLSLLEKTTKDNSTVYEFKFDHNYCYCKVVRYEIDGSCQTLEEKTFSKPKEVLTKIIEPFLNEFANQNDIIINHIIPSKENNSNLKIISDCNDMCNILNLNEIDITKLSELVGQKKKEKQSISGNLSNSENGVGNVVAFIISLIIVGIIIMGMLVPDFIG